MWISRVTGDTSNRDKINYKPVEDRGESDKCEQESKSRIKTAQRVVEPNPWYPGSALTHAPDLHSYT